MQAASLLSHPLNQRGQNRRETKSTRESLHGMARAHAQDRANTNTNERKKEDAYAKLKKKKENACSCGPSFEFRGKNDQMHLVDEGSTASLLLLLLHALPLRALCFSLSLLRSVLSMSQRECERADVLVWRWKWWS